MAVQCVRSYVDRSNNHVNDSFMSIYSICVRANRMQSMAMANVLDRENIGKSHQIEWIWNCRHNYIVQIFGFCCLIMSNTEGKEGWAGDRRFCLFVLPRNPLGNQQCWVHFHMLHKCLNDFDKMNLIVFLSSAMHEICSEWNFVWICESHALCGGKKSRYPKQTRIIWNVYEPEKTIYDSKQLLLRWMQPV